MFVLEDFHFLALRTPDKREKKKGEENQYSTEMTKSTASQEPEDTMTHLDFFKKLKRLSPLEPSLSIVSFLLVTLLFIPCFFYLDYDTVGRGITWLGLHGSLPSPSSKDGKVLPEFLDEGGDRCNIFDGNWVWDESYPLYQSQNCSFLDKGFRCTENGRPDSFYTKWRWQPKDCNLPRFDAGRMLEKLRNRRVVFVGDSIGRNHWESLLCLLSSAIPNQTSIYEVNGNPITKHSGFLVFKFNNFNCTVEYYRSPFLVVQGRAPAGAPKEVKTTLKVDKIDWIANKWRDADVLIFNAGHWWNYEKTIKMGCYFQEGKEVKMNMSVGSAYRRSLVTLIDWIRSHVNTSKTYVLFRTHSAVHFSDGGWNSGGGCHLETLPDLGFLRASSDNHFQILSDVLTEHANESQVIKLDLLEVTNMTSRRKDGHASIYYLNSGLASLHRQDCSHWCLPGVPDSWNELLYALLLKREFQGRGTSEKPSESPL